MWKTIKNNKQLIRITSPSVKHAKNAIKNGTVQTRAYLADILPCPPDITGNEKAPHQRPKEDFSPSVLYWEECWVASAMAQTWLGWHGKEKNCCLHLGIGRGRNFFGMSSRWARFSCLSLSDSTVEATWITIRKLTSSRNAKRNRNTLGMGEALS